MSCLSHLKTFRRSFRTPFLEKGQMGRPRLISWPNIAIVQVIKRRKQKVLTIERRIVQGCEKMIERLLITTQNGGVINTAYIERLNHAEPDFATFRHRLSWLARRTRHLVQQTDTLMAGMFIVGCMYNFCDNHHSLRLKLSVGGTGLPLGPTHSCHGCRIDRSLLVRRFKVPPPRWSPPERRGRPSKATVIFGGNTLTF